MMICSLCKANAEYFYSRLEKEYFFCHQCFSISMGIQNRMNANQEKAHYEKHLNDVHDKGYQQFVSPIVNAILDQFKAEHRGLDFGSGTAPVITKMLRDQKYQVVGYDLYFENKPELLAQKYDYIACCEVMEHFYNPKKEFEILFNMLLTEGKLFCKTSLYDEKESFGTWYYKNDLTHVFFYHKKTIEWIAKNIGFSSYIIEEDLITFIK